MYYILYNPTAGSGHGGDDIERVSSLAGGECRAFDITEIKDYKEFFANVGENDAVILCGGDGTLNHFANNIAELELGVDIYYYAAGTGNDFLNDVEGGKLGELILINKYLENLPTVDVNGKNYYFINGVGYGIDGYCCEVGDKLRAESDKPVNYTSIAIKGLLFGYKPTAATVTVDGVTKHYKKVWIAPTMNGRFYGGGMIPTPEQDRFNPEHNLSLMVFHDTGKLQTLMIFPSIFKGEHVKKTKAIDVLVGKEITVKFDSPRALQIDGETILGVSEYTARSCVLAPVKK